MRSDAVEELFKAHYNDAYLYTLTITKNAQEAEDIVSVAFFRALNTADKQIRDFKPWLLRVCRNEIYTRSRRNGKVATLEGDVADEAENAVEKVIRDEEYRALHKAIGLLPANLREILLLYYFEEMSVREIAEIVGKTEVNVRVGLYRGREEMKKLLEAIYEF